MSGLMGFIAIFAMWFMWEILHKRVAKDELRNELFEIRHELFMMSVEKQITFDSRFYRSFETLINGTIRYSHRIGYFQTKVAMKKFKKKFPRLVLKTEFEVEYEKIMRLKGNEELKNRVKYLKERLDKNILKYMCKTSLVFSLYILTIILASMVKYTSAVILEKNRNLMKEIEFITENEMKVLTARTA